MDWSICIVIAVITLFYGIYLGYNNGKKTAYEQTEKQIKLLEEEHQLYITSYLDYDDMKSNYITIKNELNKTKQSLERYKNLYDKEMMENVSLIQSISKKNTENNSALKSITHYKKLYDEKLEQYKSLSVSAFEQKQENHHLKDKLSELEKRALTSTEITQKLKQVQQIEKKNEENNLQLQKLRNFTYAKINDIPCLAHIFADLHNQKLALIDEHSKGKREALRANERVAAALKKVKEATFRQKEAEYKCAYYEQILPWLKDLSDEPLSSMPNNENEDCSTDKDMAKNWLSPEEYNNLSTTEKYQKALDRYFSRNKTPWEIGRDYERYIGYFYEHELGFDVQYFGIEQGLEDLGRDLICKKDNIVHIIQCKYWKKEKIIHEKHINQLFGTTVMYYLSNIDNNGNLSNFYDYLSKGLIVPVFYSTTEYSNTAKKFAQSLGVQLKIKKLDMYPMIKCNVNKTTGEKIYHLPFDQQYDKVKITSKDECYALTIKEAEEKGFRRALRWHGNNNLQN